MKCKHCGRGLDKGKFCNQKCEDAYAAFWGNYESYSFVPEDVKRKKAKRIMENELKQKED